MAEKDKPVDVNEFIKSMNKLYGANTVIRLGDSPMQKYGENVIPTGSITLDAALGVGGYPKGRIIHVLGNPSSGKTTLCLHAVAQAQKMGLHTLYIDAEHSLDVFYASEIGVDINKMYLHQPDYGEQGLNVAEAAVRSGVIKFVVVDSVAALVPKRELDGEIGDAHIGLLARMMSQTCRMMTALLKEQGATIIFVNQYREAMSQTGFGGPMKKPTGGKALEYFSSVILDIARIQSLKDGDEASGLRAKVEVKKNKVAPPYRIAEFDIVYGKGIDTYGEIIDLAEKHGLVKKSGAWYKAPDGTVISQGKQNFVKLLAEDKDYAEQLRSEVGGRILEGFSRPSNDTASPDAGAEITSGEPAATHGA